MENPTKSDAVTADTSVKEVKKIILALEAIVEESHDAIIGKSLDGVIVSWNGGATKMFGYTKEEMIGKSLTDLFAPGNQGELEGLLTKIKAGETITDYDSIWIKKDGTTADVEFSISPIHAAEKGLIIGSSLIGRDITERRKLDKKQERPRSSFMTFSLHLRMASL
jgi:PAS domain S-box-containing protein